MNERQAITLKQQHDNGNHVIKQPELHGDNYIIQLLIRGYTFVSGNAHQSHGSWTAPGFQV